MHIILEVVLHALPTLEISQRNSNLAEQRLCWAIIYSTIIIQIYWYIITCFYVLLFNYLLRHTCHSRAWNKNKFSLPLFLTAGGTSIPWTSCSLCFGMWHQIWTCTEVLLAGKYWQGIDGSCTWFPKKWRIDCWSWSKGCICKQDFTMVRFFWCSYFLTHAIIWLSQSFNALLVVDHNATYVSWLIGLACSCY